MCEHFIPYLPGILIMALIAWVVNSITTRKARHLVPCEKVANVCEKIAPYVAGAVFGIFAVVGIVSYSCFLNGDSFTSVGEAAPIIAALYFGPVAGVISTLLGVVAYLATASMEGWGETLANVISMLAVGGFVILCERRFFGGKRPALVPALFATITSLALSFGVSLIVMYVMGEVLLAVILDGQSIAISVAILLATLFSGCVIGAIGTKKENFKSAFSAVACAYLVIIIAFARIGVNMSLHKTQALLAYAVEDIEATLDGMVDASLAFVGDVITEQLGSAKRLPGKELDKFVKLYRFHELSVYDNSGECLADNRDMLPFNMNSTPETAEFQCLTDGVTRVFSQSVRKSVDGNEIRKYLGISFRDHSGYMEIGFDADKICDQFVLKKPGYFDDWQIGDTGYYLIYDGDTKCFVENTYQHDSIKGKNLADVLGRNYTLPKGDEVKRMKVFGEESYCRHKAFGGYDFLVVLPQREFFAQSALSSAIMGVLFLIILTVFGLLISRIFAANQRLAQMREKEDQRRAEDLAVAKSIQMSAMPMIFPPYPNYFQIDLYAQMKTAKEVGGDFYDFYFVGSDRLLFLVADVSGKGIPAAMFMMKAKTILKSCASTYNDLAEVVAETNVRLCEGNEASMFVTCWIGIINVRTGLLEYVNAGHNPPYIKRANGVVEELTNISGFFLAGLPTTRYTRFETQLEKGDMIYLFTDGITEANNVVGKMFGDDALREVIEGKRGMGLKRLMRGTKSVLPQELCTYVDNAVSAFTGSVPQFDDMTMLALMYRGNPMRVSLTVPTQIAEMAKVAAFVEENLLKSECPDDIRADIMVAVDEIANNVISYSGSPTLDIIFEMAALPPVVRITFVDSGTPWNPLTHLDPDITLSASERAIGGLGILMVKKLMDDVSYDYLNSQNRLFFRKALPWN